LLEAIQAQFSRIFVAVQYLIKLEITSRKKGGHKEVIAVGETMGNGHGDLFEIERLRLTGNAYMERAIEGKNVLSRLPEGVAQRSARKELVGRLEEAIFRFRKALIILKRIPDEISASAELIHVSYNHARALVERAKVETGNPAYLEEAYSELQKVRHMGKNAKNNNVVRRSNFLESDLIRFGLERKPEKEELVRALRLNHEVLTLPGKPDPYAMLAALINIGQIILELVGPAGAKKYVEEAVRFRKSSTDLRLIQWEEADVELRKLCAEVGIPF
jgi:hypothetical protein